MVPYLSPHAMFEIVKFEKSERMDILGLLPRKGICGTMPVPDILASKGLCYGMVIDVSYRENPPSP